MGFTFEGVKMRVKFFKMHGSGNDFVLIDNRITKIEIRAHTVRWLCDRKIGIGADGLLLVESGVHKMYRMRYFNADGGEVDMCGNGARCVGYFIYLADGKRAFTLETRAGFVEVEIIKDGFVRVGMPEPTSVRSDIEVPGYDGRFHFVVVGVPHLIKFVDNIDSVDVSGLGCQLRHSFIEGGTNVDFVRVVNESSIRVRTYERGVESETLSCGTGATASAYIASLLGLVKPPVRVIVNYPEALEIDFGRELRHPKLTGPATVSFTGEIDLPV